MSKALTAIAIDKLKTRPARYEVPDGGQRGLLLVVFPSGAKSFIVRYRFGGVKRKLTLGQVSLAAARKAAADALYQLHEGRDPAAAAQATKAKAKGAVANTVQAICESYLAAKDGGGKLRTADERQKTFVRLVYPEIGRVPIASLRRSQIVTLLDIIQHRCGDRMADLTLAYLRKVLNWHAGRVDDFSSPIVKGMGRYNGIEQARSRVLDDAELRAIWAASQEPKPFHALVRFLLLTAARRNEARELPWNEIDGTDWTLPAARNKTKVELLRPLSKAAQAVLATQPRGGEFVFTSTMGQRPLSLSKPKVAFDKACGVTDWTLHDLRRTARTLMSRAGIDVDHAERCLGHKLTGVRGVYDQHRYIAEMQRAFEALAAQIERIINPPPAGKVTPIRRIGRKRSEKF
jgi:integrase